MKYIRTEFGIVDTEKYDRESYIFSKESDTIKELCDWFVVEWENRKPEIMDYGNAKWNLLNNSSLVKNVFGAIWTKGGLIYVAKLNEEGELELL